MVCGNKVGYGHFTGLQKKEICYKIFGDFKIKTYFCNQLNV